MLLMVDGSDGAVLTLAAQITSVETPTCVSEALVNAQLNKNLKTPKSLFQQSRQSSIMLDKMLKQRSEVLHQTLPTTNLLATQMIMTTVN